MARNNIKNLIMSNISQKVKENLDKSGEIYVTSKVDVLMAERELDYQKVAKISDVRNMTISDIASCRKSKVSLAHLIMLMIALRTTDIRDVLDIEFEPEVVEQFKKDREKWVKEGIVPQDIVKQLNEK